MIKTLICLILLFHFGPAYPQSSTSPNQLSGIIVDGLDEKPLVNAYIYVKNFSMFNTLSDGNGLFNFSIPQAIKSDTIVVSLLGYSKVQMPIYRFSEFEKKIRLEPSLINLSEVIITPDDHSLEEFLTKAIDKIEDNYPNKKHQLSGFYRKVSFNNEDFTNLVEAAVTVQDVGYQKPTDFIKFRIDELRQGDDLEMVDSSFVYLKEKIRESIKKGGVEPKSLNDLISTYNDNFIRIAFEPKTYFGKDGGKFLGIPELPMYHALVGEEIIGKDTIYQISFSNQDPPSGKSYLKINTRNHAIVEYQMDVLNGDFQVFVKFQEYENRYYPEIIELRTLRFVNWDVGNHNMDIHTFIFDSLKTEGIKKISKKETQKVDEKISGQEFEFHPEFWNNYDLVKKHPLDSSIIRSLERYKSLHNQFKGNAKK
jgi:hypothetical protein